MQHFAKCVHLINPAGCLLGLQWEGQGGTYSYSGFPTFDLSLEFRQVEIDYLSRACTLTLLYIPNS